MIQDVEWLRQQVVTLFQDAQDRTPPDHTVCVKYAELLYKMLPKVNGASADPGDLEKIRASVMAARNGKPG